MNKEHASIRRLTKGLAILVILSVGAVAPAKDQDTTSLLDRLRTIPGADVREIETNPPYRTAYEIWLVQPVDHAEPDGRTFRHRFFLSHRDDDAAMVMYTDGYSTVWPKKRELARLLRANKLEVEHRYFGVSKPDPLSPEYFTVEQSAADHHRIIKLLKSVYRNQWITAGKSLGGMAAYTHRSLYPDDVDATVTYVAPLMRSRKDPRFIETLQAELGPATLRRLEEIQVELLRNRESVLASVFPVAETQDLYLDREALFEYSVMILPFQFVFPDTEPAIPAPGATLPQLCAFLRRNVDLSYFINRVRNTQQALHYQTATQIGYFGYPQDHLEEFLEDGQVLDCSMLTWPGEIPEFHSESALETERLLREQIEHIIYIYGERDLWTSCAVEISDRLDAVKIIAPEASHDVSIDRLSAADRELILDRLQCWTGIELQP